MPDDVDLANEQLHSELSRIINRARSTASTGKGSKTCHSCGDDIPKARRDLGFRFCVSCAENRERKRSLFADD